MLVGSRVGFIKWIYKGIINIFFPHRRFKICGEGIFFLIRTVVIRVILYNSHTAEIKQKEHQNGRYTDRSGAAWAENSDSGREYIGSEDGADRDSQCSKYEKTMKRE